MRLTGRSLDGHPSRNCLRCLAGAACRPRGARKLLTEVPYALRFARSLNAASRRPSWSMTRACKTRGVTATMPAYRMLRWGEPARFVDVPIPQPCRGEVLVRVTGVGGLGGYAVQWLSRLSATRIIAVDVAPHRVALAQEFGAHETVLSDSNVVATLLGVTDDRKAEVVFDFVGTDETIATALSVARTMGTFALVGAGGGTAPIAWGRVPLECEVVDPH